MQPKRQNLRDQIEMAATRAQSTIVDRRVDRVLNLLSDNHLAIAAAEQCGSSGSVVIESVDLPHVWEDERVVARVEELEQQGIGLETRQIEKTVGDMTFKRWAICGRY